MRFVPERTIGKAESSFSLITSSCTRIKERRGFLGGLQLDLDTRHLSARTRGGQVHCAKCARCWMTANITRERIPWKFASDFHRGRIFSAPKSISTFIIRHIPDLRSSDEKREKNQALLVSSFIISPLFNHLIAISSINAFHFARDPFEPLNPISSNS